jgi:hypothetical protein
MPNSTTSPAFKCCGGLIPKPTPAGVPVLIMSPGRSRHELGDVADQSGHIKNHFAGGTPLPEVAVNLPTHSQSFCVWNFIACRQKRSQWRKRVCTLPFHPLPATFRMKHALGIIVVESTQYRRSCWGGDRRSKSDRLRYPRRGSQVLLQPRLQFGESTICEERFVIVPHEPRNIQAGPVLKDSRGFPTWFAKSDQLHVLISPSSPRRHRHSNPYAEMDGS